MLFTPRLSVSAIPLVDTLVAAPAFALLVVALGRRLYRVAGPSLASFEPLERAVICGALGMGALQYLPFALAALGIMTPQVLRVAVAILTAALLPDAWRVGRAALELAARAPAVRWTVLPVAAPLLALLAIVAFKSASVGTGGDDDGYHLTAAKHWLAAGSLVYLPSLTMTNSPMGFELEYAAALALGSAVAAKALHLVAGAGAVVGAALLARRLGGAWAAALVVAVLLLANPVADVPFLASMAYSDLAACWVVVASALLFLGLRHAGIPAVVPVALLGGLAATFKLTSIAVGLAWVAVLARERWRAGLGPRALARAVAAAGAAAAAPVLPWLCRTWAVTGNPVFPLFPGLFTMRDMSRERAEVLARYFRYYNWGKGAGTAMPFSTRLALLVGIGTAVLAACAWLAWRLRRDPSHHLVALAGILLAAALFGSGLYFRFWLPPLALLLAVVAAAAVRRGGSAWTWAGVTASLLLVGLAVQLQGWRGAGVGSAARLALGRSSAAVEFGDQPLWKAWAYLNERTPPEARILMCSFYTSYGGTSGAAFRVERHAFVTDAHIQDYFHLDTWPEFLASVERAGIDYVVVFEEESLAARRGISFPAGDHEFPYCTRLARERGETVFRDGGVDVIRLQGSTSRVIPPIQLAPTRM